MRKLNVIEKVYLLLQCLFSYTFSSYILLHLIKIIVFFTSQWEKEDKAAVSYLCSFEKKLFMTTWAKFTVPLLVQMLPIKKRKEKHNRLATQMSHDFCHNVQDHIAL